MPLHPSDNRIIGPVEFDFGLAKAEGHDSDTLLGKTLFRCCNCCGLVLKKTKWFSYSGVRLDYSHTCRSCCSFIFLLSKEMAQDERDRPKRIRGPNKVKPTAVLWEAWNQNWCAYKNRGYDEDKLKWLKMQNRKRDQSMPQITTRLQPTIAT